MWNGAVLVENCVTLPQKIKHKIITRSSNSTSRVTLQKPRTRRATVHPCSQQRHSQWSKVETTKCPLTNDVISTYNEVLFSLKKKWNSDTHCNIEKREVKWVLQPSKINQPQKLKYCMILLIGDTRSSHMHRERKQNGGCWKLGVSRKSS